jgi:hypothetical protein
MKTRRARMESDLELLAEGERVLNRVLGYQAAMAVHQLKDDLGLEVKELSLTVAPLSSDAIGVYRVVCTITRANGPEPIVLAVIVEPDKAVAVHDEMHEEQRLVG